MATGAIMASLHSSRKLRKVTRIRASGRGDANGPPKREDPRAGFHVSNPFHVFRDGPVAQALLGRGAAGGLNGSAAARSVYLSS